MVVPRGGEQNGVDRARMDTHRTSDYARRMSTIAYRARPLGPLRAIDWAIPDGVSLLVGPNRVGKSTLLRLPELIARMLLEGVHEAFKVVFDGIPHLRNLAVSPSTPMTLGLASMGTEWEVELTMAGDSSPIFRASACCSMVIPCSGGGPATTRSRARAAAFRCPRR